MDTQLLERAFQRVNQTTKPLVGASSIAPAESPSSTIDQKTKTMVDWSAEMGSPRDSGEEGSVVGQALAATLDFYIFKRAGSRVAVSARDIYNEVRARSSETLAADGGALIKDGIEFLTKTGAVEEQAWPYRAGEYAMSLPPRLAQEKRYKITDAKRIVTLDEMKAAVDSGPAVAGITVYESLYNDDTGKTGIITMPKPKEPVIGGHAICVVGYDNEKKAEGVLSKTAEDR